MKRANKLGFIMYRSSNTRLVSDSVWQLAGVLSTLALAGVAIGQNVPQAQPAQPVQAGAGAGAGAAAAQNPGGDLSEARVVKVTGDVKTAPAGVAAYEVAKWKELKQGDLLKTGDQVRTAFGAHATLMFGDDTVVGVRQATLISIERFSRTQEKQDIGLNLGYGAVRGGSSAGALRTDFVVDSTVGTLAKRGTEGWHFEVEPTTGWIQASIANDGHGLVELISQALGTSAEIGPGQFASIANIMDLWVRRDHFDKHVTFFATEGLPEGDAVTSVENGTGISVIAAGGGNDWFNAGGRLTGAQVTRFLNNQEAVEDIPLNDLLFLFSPDLLVEPDFVVRPEGNFGTGPTFRVSRGLTAGERKFSVNGGHRGYKGTNAGKVRMQQSARRVSSGGKILHPRSR
jgi:hypothetical protein